MGLRNFGSQVQFEEISYQMPLNFMVGVAMDLMDFILPDHSDKNTLLFSSEFHHPNNFTERVNVGLEYTLIGGLISIRGGYQFNHDLAGLSAGFGIGTHIGKTNARINYSYSD